MNTEEFLSRFDGLIEPKSSVKLSIQSAENPLVPNTTAKIRCKPCSPCVSPPGCPVCPPPPPPPPINNLPFICNTSIGRSAIAIFNPIQENFHYSFLTIGGFTEDCASLNSNANSSFILHNQGSTYERSGRDDGIDIIATTMFVETINNTDLYAISQLEISGPGGSAIFILNSDITIGSDSYSATYDLYSNCGNDCPSFGTGGNNVIARHAWVGQLNTATMHVVGGGNSTPVSPPVDCSDCQCVCGKLHGDYSMDLVSIQSVKDGNGTDLFITGFFYSTFVTKDACDEGELSPVAINCSLDVISGTSLGQLWFNGLGAIQLGLGLGCGTNTVDNFPPDYSKNPYDGDFGPSSAQVTLNSGSSCGNQCGNLTISVTGA